MAKKKRKISATVKEYRKHRERIRRFIKRNEKRGFVFEGSVLPSIPKKITKASVRRLAKLTPEELYKKSSYVSRETGEVVEQSEARKMLRRLSAKKAGDTRKKKKEVTNRKDEHYNLNTDTSFFGRTTIYVWKAELAKFAHGEFYELLLSWMNSLIAENGEDNVAIMLQEAESNGVFLTWDVAYKENEMKRYTASLLDYMPDQGVMYKEQKLDALEYMKRIDTAIEENEHFESYD